MPALWPLLLRVTLPFLAAMLALLLIAAAVFAVA
jgi:hypothetical protein